MKTIKSFFFGLILMLLSTTIFSQDVAVFYSNDIAVTTVGAAVAVIKYPGAVVYDIDGLTTGTLISTVSAITDSCYHHIYILVDTATAWADNKITGAIWDTLYTKLYHVETDGYDSDTVPTLISASGVTSSKAEIMWDALFSTLTRPLVIQYLGFAEFSEARGIAKYASTDSTVIDSTQNWTDGQFDGDYVYITSGTSIGESRLIDSTYGTGEYVRTATDFTAAPSLSTYVIKKATESGEFFYDKYTELYVLAYLSDLTSSTTIKNWKKLMDYGNNIAGGGVYLTPLQDLDYLWNTVIAGGQIIFTYLSL